MSDPTEPDPMDDDLRHYAESVHPEVWAAVASAGREWLPAPRPKGIRKRADKACFLNAVMLCTQRPDLTYCEGFALTELGWVHHAWCVAGDARVVDNTWREPGLRYVGFTMPTKEVATLVVASRYWGGVLDAGGTPVPPYVCADCLTDEGSRGTAI